MLGPSPFAGVAFPTLSQSRLNDVYSAWCHGQHVHVCLLQSYGGLNALLAMLWSIIADAYWFCGNGFCLSDPSPCCFEYADR